MLGNKIPLLSTHSTLFLQCQVLAGDMYTYLGNPLLLQAVLSGSGKCPFTQRALAWEQCQVLTKGNIERFKGRVIADEATLKQFDLL